MTDQARGPTAIEPRLRRMALLSLVVALLTVGLKFGAYVLTGSVGVLADAVESLINVAAAGAAFLALWYAAQPVDRSHNYGHEKIEFFSSGFEGGLILVAAGGIGWYAFGSLVEPRPLEAIGLGTTLVLIGAIANLGVGVMLLRVARAYNSIVLEANGRHLMTDVWTSFAVIGGLGAVRLTGIERLDPLIALLVAANIARTGIDLVRRSFHGLMDRALSSSAQAAVRRAIEEQLAEGTTYHALRTRQAGARRFVDFHLLVPGRQSVHEAHELANRVEQAVEAALPGVEVTVHLEPIEEPGAWEDSELLSVERTPPVGR